MGSTRELGTSERYATGALFTLALHSTQVDNWVPAFIDVKMQQVKSGSSQAIAAAWGCTSLDDFPFTDLTEPVDLTAFWGWDSVRARGLCQRVYRHLEIPERSWPALLNLPEVAGYPSQDIKGFVQLVRQYIALLDTSVAVILAEEAEDEHVDILKKQSEVGEEVLCAPDSDPPPPIAGEGGEEVAALTLRQDEERDNGEGAATHAAAALEGKTSLPEDEDLPPSPTPEDEEQAEEMQEASRARASDILSTCFSTESDLSDSVLSAAIAEAKRSVGAAVSDEAHGGGDGRVGEGSGSSDPPMDDVKEPNARGGGTEGTGKAACPPAPLTTVTDEEGEGGEGRCLSQKPLTEHVVEDFLAAAQLPAALSPAALSSPGEGLAARNPATELPRLISRSPSGSPLSGSPRFPNRAERFSAKFSALFRLYKRVDDSEDLEDINFELEKDVMEKERRISLEADNRDAGRPLESPIDQQPLGESSAMGNGGQADDLEEDMKMPRFFEQHVHPGRTVSGVVVNKVSHERIGGLDSSPEALGVVWELLTATLNIHEDEDVVGCHEDVLGEAIERHKDPAVLVRKVRWYDARSRIAIKMVAEWLRLPWKRVLNLEALLATTYMFPQPDETRKTRHWTSSRALKVGAAAIAGGGLLALTGGLAAPTLAVGLGAAITMFGGTAAQAGIVSGLASTAAVAGTFGTYGSAVFSLSMITRTAQVSEFGFCSLDEKVDEVQAELPSAARSSTDETRTAEDEEVEGSHDEAKSDGRRSDTGSAKGAFEVDGPFDWDVGGRDDGDGADNSGGAEAPGIEHGDMPSSAVQAKSKRWAKWGRSKSQTGCQTSASTGSIAEDGETQTLSSSASRDLAVGVKEEGKRRKWWVEWWRGKTPLPTRPAPVNLSPDRCRLAVTIAVNGWVQKVDDFVEPWNVLDSSDCERYAIVWESKRLINLGGALSTFVGTKASSSLLQHFIQHFWFTGILAATSIPSLIITSSAVMDNAWSVALQRSETGGLVLANVLMARAHGDRPVKLYGFSMGARLIFHCLLELYRNGCHGIVEEVVLLGAPVSIRENRWAMARSVIAGRFINGYSKRDWVLGVLYRTANAFTRRCGGLCNVPVQGVENANLSSLISGHTDYMSKLPEILDALNLCN